MRAMLMLHTKAETVVNKNITFALGTFQLPISKTERTGLRKAQTQSCSFAGTLILTDY